MKVQILDVTPEMAKMFLMKNEANRNINKSQLEMLERSINDGHWRLTHQGIALYEDGDIADGQHRLTAIVNTGATLRMPVFTNVKRDTGTVMAIDCGLKRSVKDGATITGSNLTFAQAAICKALEFGYRTTNKVKLTHIEQYNLVSKWSISLDMSAKFFPKNTLKISITPVKVAALVAVKNGLDAEMVAAFCKTLSTGEYFDPIFINAVRVRNKLIAYNFRGGDGTRDAYNITLNAIFRTARGEKVKQTNFRFDPNILHAGEIGEVQLRLYYAAN